MIATDDEMRDVECRAHRWIEGTAELDRSEGAIVERYFRGERMSEMTRLERITAASRGLRADRLPFFHYWRHSQIGWAERECRNRGMGMNWVRPCASEIVHGLEVVQRSIQTREGTVQRTEYTTPVGTLYAEHKLEPGIGQWHPGRSWRDVSAWPISHRIKGPEDYAVAKYIIENTEYVPDYFPIEQALDWLGDDGMVLVGLPPSPMQSLLIDWIGFDQGSFFYHYADYRDMVEDLYTALCKARQPLIEIAARSPAPAVMCGENIDSFLDSPRLFEAYHMPVYKQQAEVLHAHGKLMAVHMDGRLDALKHLIAKTPIDIIEAFHPIPMGDLSLADALALWPDKAIWVGFPASVYAFGPDETMRYALDLLKEAIPGDRIVIEMSTENLVSNENLIALTSVLECAKLPLSESVIEAIRGSLNLRQ